MQEKLINCTNEVLNYIQNIPLSDTTIKYYSCCYRALTEYCQSNGCEFSSQIADEFLKYEESRYLKNEIGKVYYLLMRKATYTLLEYWNKGTITWERRKYNSKKLCEHFTNVLDEFNQSLVDNYLWTGTINLIIQLCLFKFLLSAIILFLSF